MCILTAWVKTSHSMCLCSAHSCHLHAIHDVCFSVPHPWGPGPPGSSALRNPHPKSPCEGEERRAGLGQALPTGSPIVGPGWALYRAMRRTSLHPSGADTYVPNLTCRLKKKKWCVLQRSLSVSSCLSFSCFSLLFTSSLSYPTCTLTCTPSSMSTAPRETTAAPSPNEATYHPLTGYEISEKLILEQSEGFLERLKSAGKILHGNNYLSSMMKKSSVSSMQRFM